MRNMAEGIIRVERKFGGWAKVEKSRMQEIRAVVSQLTCACVQLRDA
jgi:hypothetical protein